MYTVIIRYNDWTEFKKTELYQALENAEKQYGYMRGILLCQAYLENRGGRCEAWNFANVKATPNWLNAGKPYHIKRGLKYRSYINFQEAITDYIALVKRYYPYAWKHRHIYREYYKGLMGETNGVGYNDWAGKGYDRDLTNLYIEKFGE